MKLTISPSMEGSKEEEKKEKPEFEKYEIENGYDTLVKAHEIKNNEALMKHIHKHAAKKKAAINSVADLKKRYQDKFGNKEGSPKEEAGESMEEESKE